MSGVYWGLAGTVGSIEGYRDIRVIGIPRGVGGCFGVSGGVEGVKGVWGLAGILGTQGTEGV